MTEELLRAVKQDILEFQRGTLKIFLGLAPGAGKTYAMLEEALRLSKGGLNVAVSAIYTHDRPELIAMEEPLPHIPDVNGDLNLDAILAAHPKILFVSDLSHVNGPDAKHPKRWQDVEELLEEGIDVCTTLTIQHIESLKDTVEAITRVPTGDTVPDEVVQKATYIELIDAIPGTILKRFREGQVALTDMEKEFYKEDNLTALREIALRYVAERVDEDLRETPTPSQLKARERILVAVSAHAHSQKLIRGAKRLASMLKAPWVAVHVNNGKALTEDEVATLEKNIELARSLGAEVITTNDLDIPGAIERIAHQKGVTQIVLGRPPKRLFFDNIFRTTLLDQLAFDCSDIDIHVMRRPSYKRVMARRFRWIPSAQDWFYYLLATAAVFAATLLSAVASLFFNYIVIGLLFLLTSAVLTLWFTKGPVIYASILFVLIWNFFFVPPEGSFLIDSPDDAALMVLYLITVVFGAFAADRARQNRKMLLWREGSAEALYTITRDLSNATNLHEMVTRASSKIASTLQGRAAIVPESSGGGELDFSFAPELLLDERDKAAATWAFEHEREAGFSTNTLAHANYFCLPLRGFDRVVGVLAFRPTASKTLSPEDKNFLYTVESHIAAQIEGALDETLLLRRQQTAMREASILTAFHRLTTLLEEPRKIIRIAKGEERVWHINCPVYRLSDCLPHMVRLADTITAIVKLLTGIIPIRRKANSFKRVVEECVAVVKKSKDPHHLVVDVPPDLAPTIFDFTLTKTLVSHLLFRALDISSQNSTVSIKAFAAQNVIIAVIKDEGKALQVDPHHPPTWLILAQAIARVERFGLRYECPETGGTVFTLSIKL